MRRSARCSDFAASSTRTSPSGIFTSISSRGMGSACPTPSFGICCSSAVSRIRAMAAAAICASASVGRCRGCSCTSMRRPITGWRDCLPKTWSWRWTMRTVVSSSAGSFRRRASPRRSRRYFASCRSTGASASSTRTEEATSAAPSAPATPLLTSSTARSPALRTLGIEHVPAMTPEARGRSERCFGTLQGRLPQELRLHGVTNYQASNRYLEQTFIGDFNRRFTVRPRERGSAFSALTDIDLELLVSAQHERIVQKDNTVVFERLFLQLAPSPERMHYARCPVVVHELVDDTLAVSFQGKLIGRFDRQGTTLALQHKRKVA